MRARVAGVAGDVALVGVLGHQPEGPLLTPAPDHDPRAARLHRPGKVTGVVQAVVGPVEGDVVAGEHGPATWTASSSMSSRTRSLGIVDAESLVFHVVPGSPDAEDGPALGDDVQRGDDLGQDPRVPVGHPGDQRAQLDPPGAGRQGAEQGVRLQHGLVRSAEGRELEVVVHHPDRAEPRGFGRRGQPGHVFEEVGGVESGEVGELHAESGHEGTVPPTGRAQASRRTSTQAPRATNVAV